MLNRLKMGQSAVTTYSSVVRPWECDRNDHWNVQFYVRGFQMASEILATAGDGTNPGAASTRFRHYRFHGELFSTQTMKVLSSRIGTGPLAGHVLHRMVTGSDERLSATAIEDPACPVAGLPACTEAELRPALPRGLPAAPHAAAARGEGDALPVAPVGVVRPVDVDHAGLLQWHAIAGFCSAASHGFLSDLGLDAAWITEANCNRMAVEMTTTMHAPCRAGTMLDVVSWIADTGSRHFTARHQIVDAVTGAPLASLDQLMLMIDLDARKPVALPDFLRRAGPHPGPGDGA